MGQTQCGKKAYGGAIAIATIWPFTSFLRATMTDVVEVISLVMVFLGKTYPRTLSNCDGYL
jgi:hypothetical protein